MDRPHAGHIRVNLDNSILQKASVPSLSPAKWFPFPKTTTVSDPRVIILNNKSDNVISTLKFSGSPLLLG